MSAALAMVVPTWTKIVFPMLLGTTAVTLTVLLLCRWVPLFHRPPLRRTLLTAAMLSFLIPPIRVLLPAGVAWPPSMRFTLGHPGGPPLWAIGLLALHGLGFALALGLLAWRGRQMQLLLQRARPVEQAELRRCFARMRQRVSAPAASRLVSAEGIRVPFACGILQPTVVIPRGLIGSLSEDEMSAVLAHELVHLRDRDAPQDGLLEFVRALWWFHPLAHVLVRRLRDAREEACDDTVLDHRIRIAEYGRALVKVGEFAAHASGSTAAVALAGRRGHSLAQRLERLLGRARGESAQASGGLAWVRAVGLVLILLAAAAVPEIHRTYPDESTSPGGPLTFGHSHKHNH